MNYPWSELQKLAKEIRRKLEEARETVIGGHGHYRVHVDSRIVPVSEPEHPIEIFAFHGMRPDPDVSTATKALKHAFREDPDIEVREDIHGERTIEVWMRPHKHDFVPHVVDDAESRTMICRCDCGAEERRTGIPY